MGKQSAPAAPDYAGAARETAAGNMAAAQEATKANRINQYTPYGSLTYSHTGEDPNAGWSQNVSLSPQAQAALDKQMSMSNRYADLASQGLDKAQGTLSNPNLDMSAVPKRAIDVGQTAQEAILSRLNPQIQSQEESLRQRLANQGIGLGSEAYGREMQLQGQKTNDLNLQAALQGINLDQTNRQNALQEQAYIQDRPLNLINALRTGTQIQNPTFTAVPQQQTTAGPNLSQAASNSYDAALNSYNAQNAQSGGLMKGLFGLATTPLAGTGLGGLFGF